MADALNITLAVGRELSGNYQNYYTGWNVPDPAGKADAAGKAGAPTAIVMVGMKVIRATWFKSPAMKLSSGKDFTRSSSAPAIPEPVGPVNATNEDPAISLYGALEGEIIPNWTGPIEFEIEIPQAGDGAVFATLQDHPFFWCLASTFGFVVADDVQDVVADDAADAGAFEPTAPNDYRVGETIMVVRNGAYEFAHVSAVDRTSTPPVVSLAGDLPGGPLSAGDRIVHCITMHEQLGSTQRPVVLQMDMEDARMYACGCRLESMQISEDDDGIAVAKCVMQPGVILRDDQFAETIASSTSSAFVVQRLQACSTLSTEIVREAAAPGGLEVAEFCPQQVSFEVTAKLQRQICKKRLGGVEQITVGSTQMTASLVRSRDDVLERMHWRRQNLIFGVGYGPAVQSGGHGMHIGMMAAHRTDLEMGIDEDGDNQQQLTVELAAGEYSLDIAPSGADPTSTATNTPWRIAFPMIAPVA